MPRPKGSRNRKPGKAEIDTYLMMLRNAARDGDIQAAGVLVQRDTVLRAGDKQVTDNGSRN